MFMANKDCDENIQSYINLTGLSKMMTTNKDLNKHSMKLLGVAYKKRTPKTGLMHLGRLISAKTHEASKKFLLPGLKNSEAVLNSTCMLCDKGVTISVNNGVSEFGFMAHNKCLKRKLVILNDKVMNTLGVSETIPCKSRIEEDMIPYLPSLRKRKRTYGDLGTFGVYDVIESGIDGVYPHELSWRGYEKSHAIEVCRARLIAGDIRLKFFEKIDKERVARDDVLKLKKDRKKAEIEKIVGMSFDDWKWSFNEDPCGPQKKKQKTNGICREFYRNALRFNTGQECIQTLEEIERNRELDNVKDIRFILSSFWEGPIDISVVAKKIAYKKREKYINDKIDYFLHSDNVERYFYYCSQKDNLRFDLEQNASDWVE